MSILKEQFIILKMEESEYIPTTKALMYDHIDMFAHPLLYIKQLRWDEIEQTSTVYVAIDEVIREDEYSEYSDEQILIDIDIGLDNYEMMLKFHDILPMDIILTEYDEMVICGLASMYIEKEIKECNVPTKYGLLKYIKLKRKESILNEKV